MDYFYVLKSNTGYFSGWLPIPEIDEPNFTTFLGQASSFEYSQAQYMQEILEHNHKIKTEIKKVILAEDK